MLTAREGLDTLEAGAVDLDCTRVLLQAADSALDELHHMLNLDGGPAPLAALLAQLNAATTLLYVTAQRLEAGDKLIAQAVDAWPLGMAEAA